MTETARIELLFTNHTYYMYAHNFKQLIDKFLCFPIDIEPYIKSKNAMSIKFRLCLNYFLSKLSNYDEDVG